MRRLWSAGLLVVLAVAGAMGGTISFVGDLRTDANVIGCGQGCTLDLVNDPDWVIAQWAARVETFNLAAPTTGYAVTFSYGGGTNGAGTAIAPGGFEPYLSLFDGAGNFLLSTYLGEVCPAGANSYDGFCYDVKLDFGTLPGGTYQIALSVYMNMSLAENWGSGTLADGFTGLGNLAGNEDLHYAFDVVQSEIGVPEPATVLLFGTAFLAIVSLRKWSPLRPGKGR